MSVRYCLGLDAEDAWERIDGISSDGQVGFNISRKHNERYQAKSNPVIISVLLHDVLLRPESVGQRISKEFGVPVVAHHCADTMTQRTNQARQKMTCCAESTLVGYNVVSWIMGNLQRK